MMQPILQFIQARGSGEAALRRFLTFAVANGENPAFAACASVSTLVSEIGLKEDVARNIVDARGIAEKLAVELQQQSIVVVWLGSEMYPERLSCILGDDAPPALFLKGNQSLLRMPAVGFCGSRKASDKGLTITERCASQLAQKEICVVSGYAHGVDMAAHRAALTSGGTTILVLVEGILRFEQKKEIAHLFTSENHLVVSQFPPRLTWSGRNAMRRNSTIIGLSDAMVLVESGTSGGTFAAGEETLKRKRPLFVIDFATPGQSAEANPYFIQHGGIPVRGNGQGIPNLEQVRHAVAGQSWRRLPPETPSLFNWREPHSSCR